jgi:retinol dehydrogenase-12
MSTSFDLDSPIELRGRTCLITGATSGHGRAVALALGRAGAELILLGRDERRCAAIQRAVELQTGRTPEVLLCDLSQRASIDEAAAALRTAGRPLHVLVNNAGLVNQARRETADGVEMVFAVNYLAYFQLSLRLLPLLQAAGSVGAPARIVNVASDTHRLARLDLDDLELRRGYGVMRAYGRSKLAIVYFTLELARRLRELGSPVTVNAVDPGPVRSRIGLNNRGLAADLLEALMRVAFPEAARAARTAVQLCASPAVQAISGGYFKFGKQRAPGSWIERSRPQRLQRLWAISAAMTGADLS